MVTKSASSSRSAIALMFPGQGAQFPGMASDIVSQDEECARILESADQILGYPLSEIMAGKRGAELDHTVYTQPAIFVHSTLVWRLVQRRLNIRPIVAAGHSLGEYSALCAAGALDFADALRVVKARAEAMHNAQPLGSCGMAAVIGIPVERIREIVLSVKEDSILDLANLNSPDQSVISGEIEALERAVRIIGKEKKSRVVRLHVSSAFHTSLMESARDNLTECLKEVNFGSIEFAVIANVNAEPYPGQDRDMKSLLLDQVVSPVLWEGCVRKMIGMGARIFLEVGPGRVLSGLLKRIDRSVSAISLSDYQSVENLEGALP
ncbi:MAG: ACP S-malonyltransferase [Pseudomonadota bacterium]